MFIRKQPIHSLIITIHIDKNEKLIKIVFIIFDIVFCLDFLAAYSLLFCTVYVIFVNQVNR